MHHSRGGAQRVNSPPMRKRFAYRIATQPAAAILSLLAAAIFASPASRAESPQAASAMIVLDGSGSMWGQIPGGNKIVIARAELGDMFAAHDASMAIGLVAFGHRKPIGCDDIETMSAPKTGQASRHRKLIAGINPKGSTPIAAALRQAAEAAPGDKPLDIVLIADGPDNCRRDPCQVSRELKATAPALRAHVITFTTDADAPRSLACIAENTGGTFAEAANADAFAAALSDAFAAIAAPRSSPAVAQADLADESSVGSILEEGSTDLDDWGAIETDGDDSEAIQRQLQLAQAPDGGEAPQAPAAGGSSPLSLTALVTESGPKIEDGIVWRVFNPKPGPDGGYRLIATHREAAPKIVLPAGEYLINAAYGLSNLTRKVTVEAGKPLDERFVLNTGGLKLGAVLSGAEGVVPENVRYEIFTDDTDQFGNRERLLENARPGLVIRLNSGVYHIVSQFGDANAVVRADVTIEPGKLTEATVNHSAAQVTFKLVSEAGGEALADTQWTVTSSGGDVIKESAGALPTHILAAGDYTVTARHGGLTHSRSFKVESGKPAQVEVVMKQ
jgi:hypothetical protein